MPIEFQCSVCQTVLRTPDGSQGKSARCPGCSNVQPIPGGPSGAPDIPEGIPVSAPAPAPARNNPYAKPTSDIAPIGNPYATSGVPAFQGMNAARAKSRVQPAAITWLVVSILISLLYVLAIIGGIVNIVTEQALPEDVFTMVVCVVMLFLLLMGVIGAISMLRMRNRKLAITGAICTMLPASCCFLLPLGASIWALVVLLDSEIKPYFS